MIFCSALGPGSLSPETKKNSEMYITIFYWKELRVRIEKIIKLYEQGQVI
jgi:hypothetical protein